MNKYTVDEKPLQDVLNYLATKPYSEVATLVAAIQASAKLVLEQTVEKVNNEEASKAGQE